MCKFILKKNIDFQVTNFISMKEGFSQSLSRFVKFNTNITLTNCQQNYSVNIMHHAICFPVHMKLKKILFLEIF